MATCRYGGNVIAQRVRNVAVGSQIRVHSCAILADMQSNRQSHMAHMGKVRCERSCHRIVANSFGTLQDTKGSHLYFTAPNATLLKMQNRSAVTDDPPLLCATMFYLQHISRPTSA